LHSQKKKEDVGASTLDPQDIVDSTKGYVGPIIEYFKTANADDISRFRNRGSSRAGVDQNCMQMMAIINTAKGKDFAPREVQEWTESQDAQGTKRAGELIDEVNKIIRQDIIDTLTAKFGSGEKGWWMKGVPPKVRTECDEEYNKQDSPDLDRWGYLYLVNYAEIVTYQDNWELFREYYDFYSSGKKADRMRWLVKLNRARNITHHTAEKGPLPRDQIAFVQRVHALLKEHIEQHKKLDPKKSYLSD
jgi:DNA sulfur modification protein DndB